jgi:indole-3-glycerol phosphate synthase
MTFLDKLRPIKHQEVNTLKAHPPKFERVGSRPSFKQALQNPGQTPNLIAEIKLHSPTKGHLQDPKVIETILPLYNQYAQAISVLTDKHFFKGSFERLNHIAQHSDLPLLCKDFIDDPFQIELAKQAGASAILLIVNYLKPEQLRQLHQTAQNQGLDVLVEVHNASELEQALAIEADIIGINHRDLETLKINLNVSHELIPKIPAETITVAESGLYSAADLAALPPVDAVLIGTSIMSADNPETILKELTSTS